MKRRIIKKEDRCVIYQSGYEPGQINHIDTSQKKINRYNFPLERKISRDWNKKNYGEYREI